MKTLLTEHKITKKQMIVSMLWLHLLTLIPMLLLIKYVYGDIFNQFIDSFKQNSLKIKTFYFFIFFVVYIIAIIIHELIHGFFFARYNISGWKGVKFGFMPEILAAYANSKEPISVKQYRIVAIMPTIILGFFPFILFLLTQNVYIFIFSFFLILGGIGDFLILWTIRKLNSGQLIIDHPKTLGYFLIENFHQEELPLIKEKISKLTSIDSKNKKSKKYIFKFIFFFLLGFISIILIKKFMK